jgi:hypothetical protein
MGDDGIIDISSFGDDSIISLNDDDNDMDSHNIDIQLNSSPKSASPKPSVNFGGGIELLMNDKKKKTDGKSDDIKLTELDSIEDELNELTNDIADSNIKVHFEKEPTIGSETIKQNIDLTNTKKSWDGFPKTTNIPNNPDIELPTKPKLSQEELIREKFKYLRRLEDLEKKGVSLSKKYTMESPLSEMQGEYELIISEKEKANSCKFQGRMLMAAVTGLEFLNTKFDPFDFKLDGWSEQINENIDDYDEIFGELHEKYKSKATMAPELKLLFQLGGSAIMVHMTNTMFKSSMPGMDDIMRQNPELAQQFTQAAVNSMSDNNPGFSGFMNNFMGGAGEMGQPPPTVPAESLRSQRTDTPQNRPDLNMAKDTGINVNNNYDSFDHTRSQPPPPPAPQRSTPNQRPEMSGPSDITELLSGLKTQKIDVQDDNNDSTISIQELKEMSSANTSMGKSKRKPKSNKNTIALDI